MVHILAVLLAINAVLFGNYRQEDKKEPSKDDKKTQEIKRKLEDSYTKATDWLTKTQNEKGYWGMKTPAGEVSSMGFTCLASIALINAPASIKEKNKKSITKAVDFIVSSQNKDGSFSESAGMLKTYCTALAVQVLCAQDAKTYKKQIDSAQTWLKSAQTVEGLFEGGSGYGDKEPDKQGGVKTSQAADLSNTGFTAEAMHMSNLSKDDEYWKKMVAFVQKCQNNSETNTDKKWIDLLKSKGFKVGDDGGSFYNPDPDNSKAETTDEKDGKVIASYGAMTYHTIKCYLYAGLEKTDPRVKAAIDWVRKNYTVNYHPGFPFEETTVAASKRKQNMGLYYYYMVMARALDAFGENPFETADKKKHNWAQEITEKLLGMQKEDGTWINENPKWYEGDKLLVTSYVLNVYNILHKNLK